MKRGGKILCSVAVVAVAACSTQPELRIRPTGTPLSMQAKPVPVRIAEARAQFALGNVALALESFRKASREDPASVDALAGIAACYDRMARYDLSRRYYEMALAIAPGDTQLLASLAGSLDDQGAREEAAAVRQEIALRLAAARAAAAPAPELVEVASRAAPAAGTSEPPIAIAAAQSATPEMAPPAFVAPQRRLDTVPAIEPQVPTPSAPVEIADRSIPAAAPSEAAPALQPLPEPAIGPSVTIDLPPARSADAVLTHAPEVAMPVPDPAPAPEPEALPEPRLASSAPLETGPRIERLSMGAVALITADRPRWQAKTIARTERSTTVRFVPLREANARQSRVRVLNAARVDRLATRTRAWLTARGWSRMPIGDAPTARARSLVVYPAEQRELARTLANQFGFEMEERADAKFVTMLLGRDAARIEELQPKNA